MGVDFLLLLTAAIWGFAFVAQRLGMMSVGPFTYNAVRFLLGGLSLIPLALWLRAGRGERNFRQVMTAGLISGAVLFAGASLQQVGIVDTTAGNAGFITGLYVVIVPVLGLFLRHRTGWANWVGAGLAAMGLYLLSVTDQLTIGRGDLLVLIGAFFWAIHVLVIGHFSRRVDPLWLSIVQFLTCGLLSGVTALAGETLQVEFIWAARGPILYGGLLSVGVAYTLQVISQQKANPAHAAILLSLESVFAALGGWWIMGEMLSGRGILGCGLMLTGMLISQLASLRPAGDGAQSRLDGI
jgi:drug/metabolite transporter (DMT)-like permease